MNKPFPTHKKFFFQDDVANSLFLLYLYLATSAVCRSHWARISSPSCPKTTIGLFSLLTLCKWQHRPRFVPFWAISDHEQKKGLNNTFVLQKSPLVFQKNLQINIPSQNFVCWGSPSHLAFVTHFRCVIWGNPTFDNHRILSAKLLNSDTKKESSAPRTPQRNTNTSSLGKQAAKQLRPKDFVCKITQMWATTKKDTP